jgi:hypothetical protein
VIEREGARMGKGGAFIPFEIKETKRLKRFADRHAQAYASASHENLVSISGARRNPGNDMVWEDMQARRGMRACIWNRSRSSPGSLGLVMGWPV